MHHMWITTGFLIAFALSAASELDSDEDAIVICTEEQVNAECAHANSGYEIVGVALRSCSTNSAQQSKNETCVQDEYIAQLQQRLDILEEKLKSIDEKMDQEVNSTNGRMTIVDNKLETIDNMFLIVTNSVATSINEVKTINDKITTIDDKLEQEVNSANSRITDMDNKFQSINHTLSTVNNSVDNSINEVMIINNKITTTDHKLERMEQELNSTNTRITDNDKKLATTNNMFLIVTNSVATSINEVKTINDKITSIDDRLEQLGQEVNSSDSRITDIENQLETLNNTLSTVNTSVSMCVNRVMTIDNNITAIINDLQNLNQSMSTMNETIETAVNKTGQNDWTTTVSPTTTADPTEAPGLNEDYRAAREELERSGEIAIVGDREGLKVTELTWRVDKIEEDIDKAKVDQNYNISKSFYSDAPGYRMTLYMYPRSVDSSSIIVCSVLMPGMFDKAVEFPMKQRYKITSIDQDGQQFATNSFTYIHEQDSQLSSLPQPSQGSSRQCYSFHIITDTLMSMKDQLLPDGHLSIRTTFYFDN